MLLGPVTHKVCWETSSLVVVKVTSDVVDLMCKGVDWAIDIISALLVNALTTDGHLWLSKICVVDVASIS